MHQILIADDDLATRSLFARVLTRDGYCVETVDDGNTAVEKVAAVMPDLLITDLFMPGLNGWSVFSRVRRLAPQLPILIISGASTATPPDAAILPHHAVFLRKPVAMDQVRTTVARLLAERPVGGASGGDAPVGIYGT